VLCHVHLVEYNINRIEEKPVQNFAYRLRIVLMIHSSPFSQINLVSFLESTDQFTVSKNSKLPFQLFWFNINYLQQFFLGNFSSLLDYAVNLSLQLRQADARDNKICATTVGVPDARLVTWTN
jgi:hypothetical protein